MSNQPHYVGKELGLFAEARTWKQYFRSFILPYLGRTVLEVGAGLGATTSILCTGSELRWTCLEPDAALRNQIDRLIEKGDLPPCCKCQGETIEGLDASLKYETILYIDVLEHIREDKRELELAAERLVDGGHLIVLSPAYNSLFGPFDRAIGHHRRYNSASLTRLTPGHCKLVNILFMDCVGLIASLANKVVLKQSLPTREQVLFWDRYLVKTSRILDRFLGYRVGRSVLAVWRRN